MSNSKPFKIAVICGGPSPERGISLNSARSILDHLSSGCVQIVPLYVDRNLKFYAISAAQLYSNTPDDFDFKLQGGSLSETEAARLLKSVDLVFPVIHGTFGEDGEIQALLEELRVPFVGSGSQSCKTMYDKQRAKLLLQKEGLPVLPSIYLVETDHCLIDQFLSVHGKAVVKPACGGSSIGVFLVENSKEAIEKCDYLLEQKYQGVLLEAFCDGIEFTQVVFEKGALIPTEIELDSQAKIFDYRRKYLPTNQVATHTPPRFPLEIIEKIRAEAEQVFQLFSMRDFVRMDGWVSKEGVLYFSDFNPLSGLEQNSFFFRQAAAVGLTHKEALGWVVKNACQRYGISFPDDLEESSASKSPVYVLFGGDNAERQVSLMSGTNVWLKLLRSSIYRPTPFFFDCQGDIWELPYAYTLDHSVEEIYANCLNAKERACFADPLIKTIQRALQIGSPAMDAPKHYTADNFFRLAQQNQAFVFIAMHGGVGEDGTLQTLLEQAQIPFNGSDAAASALGMDKYLAGEKIRALSDPDIFSLPKICLCDQSPPSWEQVAPVLGDSLIIKPQSDGCSAGVVRLRSESDYIHYLQFIKNKTSLLPPCTFLDQNEAVQMSNGSDFILEPYIETDTINIDRSELLHFPKEGWVELTVGVLEQFGIYHSLTPSIAVADGAVLSLEEKFQGGTGVNLTPPPEAIVSHAAREKIMRSVEKIGRALGIQNYARIDLFFNYSTGKLVFIEVNTLPGLTPSTVLFHQALAEDPPLAPAAFLEKLVSSKAHQLQHTF